MTLSSEISDLFNLKDIDWTEKIGYNIRLVNKIENISIISLRSSVKKL